MLTHEQLKVKALESYGDREEYDQVNREEFALLDMILPARRGGLILTFISP